MDGAEFDLAGRNPNPGRKLVRLAVNLFGDFTMPSGT